jgi:hypothetical protein
MINATLDDALFAVLVFRPEGVEFFCGTGDSLAVRRWSENSRASPAALRAEVDREFQITAHSLWLSRESAEAWLGRTW